MPDGPPDDAAHDAPASPAWTKQTIALSPTHRWKAAAGFKILVLDAGAVRFDIPESWHVIPKSDAIGVHDKRPPQDECRVTVTVFKLPRLDGGRTWDDLPIDEMLTGAMRERAKGNDKRHGKSAGKPGDGKPSAGGDRMPTHVRRPDLEYAWRDTTWSDKQNGGRVVYCRQTIARARGVMPLITYDCYANRKDEFLPTWDHLIRSLRLGAPVNLLGDALN